MSRACRCGRESHHETNVTFWDCEGKCGLNMLMHAGLFNLKENKSWCLSCYSKAFPEKNGESYKVIEQK